MIKEACQGLGTGKNFNFLGNREHFWCYFWFRNFQSSSRLSTKLIMSGTFDLVVLEVVARSKHSFYHENESLMLLVLCWKPFLNLLLAAYFELLCTGFRLSSSLECFWDYYNLAAASSKVQAGIQHWFEDIGSTFDASFNHGTDGPGRNFWLGLVLDETPI